MFGRFREIRFAAPLSEPLDMDAFHLPSSGRWRVVVFPGSPCNRLLFTRLLRTAPQGVDMVVLSRPGFGTGHTKVYPDFNEQVAALRPFLPGGPYGDKNVITLGVSYGGELALKAALDFPDQVHGVVTVAALIDEPHDYALKLEQIGGASAIEPFVPNRWHKVRTEIAERRGQIGPVLEALPSLKKPVEVLHGDFDALVPRSNAQTLIEALGPEADAALEIIPGGTHYLEMQYPRRLHRAIQRVISRAEQQTDQNGLHEAQSAGKTA
ncbi:alpha/beta hydrolase [Hyphococcus formosus]|uniref:alpha/beta fold hydrolase n=1 Tax=Hyphococcus formosus TaxID=3143534 RepID=UPI00398B1ACE